MQNTAQSDGVLCIILSMAHRDIPKEVTSMDRFWWVLIYVVICAMAGDFWRRSMAREFAYGNVLKALFYMLLLTITVVAMFYGVIRIWQVLPPAHVSLIAYYHGITPQDSALFPHFYAAC